ncbi:tail protein X [Pseudomonas sp. RA_5y_Pfl1_P24]|uniref:tail protein X n=1 Tax=Pseudomonas sp. RA_5y_Pfl1_P24 TaxID=3088706 RepID=UPI0030DAE8E2
MAMICRTSDGDLLDTLCYQHYGHLNGTVEAVLAANRLLADEPQPLRVGLLITFPEIERPAVEQVQLWD